MSISLDLYNEALRIGQIELEALQSGEVEIAEEYCIQRAELLEKAWTIRDANDEQIRSKLFAIKELQELLFQEATKLKKNIQQQLSNSRQQKKGLNGYRLSVGQANKLLEEEIQNFSSVQ